MNTKLSTSLVIVIIVAAVGSVLVAHYDTLLPHRWETYTAPDRTFSINLPDKPDVETGQWATTDSMWPEAGGIKIENVATAKPTNHTEYICVYIEHGYVKGIPDEVLEFVRDTFFRRILGTVLNQKRITVQGHPGLEMQGRASVNLQARGLRGFLIPAPSRHAVDSLVDARLVVVGDRLYILIAIAREQDREPKTVRRMFDSFKLNEM
jgi:hypothetical protein